MHGSHLHYVKLLPEWGVRGEGDDDNCAASDDAITPECRKRRDDDVGIDSGLDGLHGDGCREVIGVRCLVGLGRKALLYDLVNPSLLASYK